MVHVSSASKFVAATAGESRSSASASLRVLAAVADDLTLDGVRMSCPGCKIVAAVKDGWAMLASVDECSPDLIIADLDMQGLDGIEAAARLKCTHPGPLVIILATEAAYELVEEAFEAGAGAYVLKSDMSRDLAPAILAALEGQRYVSMHASKGS